MGRADGAGRTSTSATFRVSLLPSRALIMLSSLRSCAGGRIVDGHARSVASRHGLKPQRRRGLGVEWGSHLAIRPSRYPVFAAPLLEDGNAKPQLRQRQGSSIE